MQGGQEQEASGSPNWEQRREWVLQVVGTASTETPKVGRAGAGGGGRSGVKARCGGGAREVGRGPMEPKCKAPTRKVRGYSSGSSVAAGRMRMGGWGTWGSLAPGRAALLVGGQEGGRGLSLPSLLKLGNENHFLRIKVSMRPVSSVLTPLPAPLLDSLPATWWGELR